MAVELELGFLTIPQAGLVELIEVGAAAGFDAITATPTLYRQAGLSDAALRARLRDAGVRVTYIDGFGGARRHGNKGYDRQRADGGGAEREAAELAHGMSSLGLLSEIGGSLWRMAAASQCPRRFSYIQDTAKTP